MRQVPLSRIHSTLRVDLGLRRNETGGRPPDEVYGLAFARLESHGDAEIYEQELRRHK